MKAPGIERDSHGIPTVRAGSAREAWFGLGYAAAGDRLWQMEYDRRRASGRWAELIGPAGVAADTLARKLRLRESAEADIAGMSPATRDIFDAYAEGANAYLAAAPSLPPEYSLTGAVPEPWEPWHSIAAFKVRHILMSTWQLKLVNATVLALAGPTAFQRLESGRQGGTLLTIPPGARSSSLYLEAAADLAATAAELGFLSEVEAGSNAWAVSGARSSSGLPVLCNDSHRALDCPNAYWQARVRCPEFEVAGATFPGLPGFPHFGENGQVAWAITNTGADVQDLYLEQFRPVAAGLEVRTAAGWQPVEARTETVLVAGSGPVTVETWATGNGVVVHGDPRRGRALSLRWTATAEPCRGFEVLGPMLSATTVEELFATQRGWVDPVNNLVAADTAGSFGYLLRGQLPIRSNAARHLPVPGWEPEHCWRGVVPDGEMPATINPAAGYVVTCNQAVTDGDDPYIATVFADTARCERITELILAAEVHSPAGLAQIQSDVTSPVARRWVQRLAGLEGCQGPAEEARARLAGWDGRLDLDRAEPLLYSCFRREVSRAVLEPVIGPDGWAWLLGASLPPAGKLVRRWTEAVLRAGPGGFEPELRVALARAWAAASALAGPDPRLWRYGDHHRARARHPLAARAASAGLGDWNPPGAPMGGDSDTVQAAAYSPNPGAPFDVTNLSVYRQVVDMADPAAGTWIIPGGASGDPGSPHYTDQLELWAKHRRLPIRSAPPTR